MQGEGSAAYFGLTSLEASKKKWFAIQKVLTDMNFVLTDIRRNFNGYFSRLLSGVCLLLYAPVLFVHVYVNVNVNVNVTRYPDTGGPELQYPIYRALGSVPDFNPWSAS